MQEETIIEIKDDFNGQLIENVTYSWKTEDDEEE